MHRRQRRFLEGTEKTEKKIASPASIERSAAAAAAAPSHPSLAQRYLHRVKIRFRLLPFLFALSAMTSTTMMAITIMMLMSAIYTAAMYPAPPTRVDSFSEACVYVCDIYMYNTYCDYSPSRASNDITVVIDAHGEYFNASKKEQRDRKAHEYTCTFV